MRPSLRLTRYFLVLGLLCCAACTPYFKPVTSARAFGVEALACDEVEVYLATDDAWHGSDVDVVQTYQVQGCGRQAWVLCSRLGRGGDCTEVDRPYLSPDASEPHAVLVTEVRYPAGSDRSASEALSFAGHGTIRRGANGSLAIPIRAESTEIEWVANLNQTTVTHGTTQRSTTSTSRETRFGQSYRVTTTRYYTVHYTTRDFDRLDECRFRLNFTPRAGSAYHLRAIIGTGTCELECTELVQRGGEIVEQSCGQLRQ